MNDQEISVRVARTVAKAPQWIRQDLSARDVSKRTRAEESLAAMIAAALTGRGAEE